MRFVIGSSALLLLASAPRAALANERAFSLSWEAPSECPDGAALERYVDQVLGDAATGPVTVRASGTASRTAEGRYAATVELDIGAGAPSTRTLDGRDCEAVSQAAALVIALAIRARASESAPPPPAPAAKPPEPAPAPAPAIHVASGAGARGFFALGAIADLGSTPAVTLGLGLSGGVNWAGVRLEPSVGYFAPRSDSVAGRTGVGARFSLVTAGARLCAPLSHTALWVAPCVGGGVDWLRGEGFGARVPKDGSAWSGIARASVLAGWDISSILTLRLELEAVVPLARPEFQVEGAGPVYRRSAIAARAAFGLDVHF